MPSFAALRRRLLSGQYMDGETFGGEQVQLLVIGNLIAFVVAMLAIKTFINYLTKHGFLIFGYYRIIIGVVILVLYYLGIELAIV